MVCTANICRSATGQFALTALLREQGISADQVDVSSAGVAAGSGYSMCETSEQLLTAQVVEVADATAAHTSRRLTRELAQAADLILTADRSHRGAVLQLAPRVRPRVFTLRQAARLATWIVGESEILRVAGDVAAGAANPFSADDPRSMTMPLPDGTRARYAWLVEEMDASRGMAPRASGPSPTELAASSWHEDDVEDPHVEGWGLHKQSVPTVVECCRAIAVAYAAVTSATDNADS